MCTYTRNKIVPILWSCFLSLMYCIRSNGVRSDWVCKGILPVFVDQKNLWGTLLLQSCLFQDVSRNSLRIITTSLHAISKSYSFSRYLPSIKLKKLAQKMKSLGKLNSNVLSEVNIYLTGKKLVFYTNQILVILTSNRKELNLNHP